MAVGPRCAVLYIEEVGTAALDTRFAAATVSHRPNPSPIEREALLRREAYLRQHSRHSEDVPVAGRHRPVLRVAVPAPG